MMQDRLPEVDEDTGDCGRVLGPRAPTTDVRIAVRERPSRRFLICSPQSEASERFVMTITE